MPNVAYTTTVATAAPPLPHAVPLPDLSFRALDDRFGPAFDACRAAARAVAGEGGWTAEAVHEPGRGTGYVFRFACAMASLRFSADAAVAAAAAARCSWPARRDPD